MLGPRGGPTDTVDPPDRGEILGPAFATASVQRWPSGHSVGHGGEATASPDLGRGPRRLRRSPARSERACGTAPTASALPGGVGREDPVLGHAFVGAGVAAHEHVCLGMCSLGHQPVLDARERSPNGGHPHGMLGAECPVQRDYHHGRESRRQAARRSRTRPAPSRGSGRALTPIATPLTLSDGVRPAPSSDPSPELLASREGKAPACRFTLGREERSLCVT